MADGETEYMALGKQNKASHGMVFKWTDDDWWIIATVFVVLNVDAFYVMETPIARAPIYSIWFRHIKIPLDIIADVN